MRVVEVPQGSPQAVVEYLRLRGVLAISADEVTALADQRAFNLAVFGGARGGGKHPRPPQPQVWQRDPYA